MPVTLLSSRVIILVKALPQASSRYGETVCCAGVTADREWKRLFPVRFRHLSGDHSFSRWDWVAYEYRLPTTDRRKESCHVYEDRIITQKAIPEKERAEFLNPIIKLSIEAAIQEKASLALIRPRSSRFTYKRKSDAQIAVERKAFEKAAQQTSIFDKELAVINPSPYEFRFKFEDTDGTHNYRNGDWEAHTMYWREARKNGENAALDRMDHIFNEVYPKKGMVFAVGNQQKRPQTWQLLGVIRLDEVSQQSLL